MFEHVLHQLVIVFLLGYVLLLAATHWLCPCCLVCAATIQGVVVASTANMAWQGSTLQLSEFTDRASYSISAASAQSAQALLAAASGGVVLEAWLYVNKYVTYARGNANLIGILNRSKFFGLRVSLPSCCLLGASSSTRTVMEVTARPQSSSDRATI